MPVKPGQQIVQVGSGELPLERLCRGTVAVFEGSELVPGLGKVGEVVGRADLALDEGLTHGEIAAHLAEVYAAEVPKQTISTITNKVMEGMADRQNRPLDRVHPVLFVNTINVKIRDGQVANRPVYVVMAVTVYGTRDIVGIWAGDGGEGAKYWLHVFTELKNRGLDDVLMLVCDGLKGFPEAVEAVWPRTIVQTCVFTCCGIRSEMPPVWTGTRSPRPSSLSTSRPARTRRRSGSWSSRRHGAESIRRS